MIKTIAICERKSLVSTADFASVVRWKSTGNFLDLLPHISKGIDLRELVASIVVARENKRPVLVGIGAHVIKCGLSPLLIDLMKKGFITAIAMNGACAIHDYEIALCGRTSEDVGENLPDGSFGMARETAIGMGEAIRTIDDKAGLGKAFGSAVKCLPYKHFSILGNAFELNIPATVHVTIGADVIHMHPEVDSSLLGYGSYQDFLLLSSLISKLDGGCYLNIGSAVTLPEVFLKALSLARNLGHTVDNFTTANFDMIKHYRPDVNVVKRPHFGGKGKGHMIIGYHEIMIPLLYSLLVRHS